MSNAVFNVLDFGAVADGRANDAAAIQRAIDACADAGGGRVLIPSGATLRAGSFSLRSNIDFHVAQGACLLSATEKDAFPGLVFDSGPEADKRFWIGGKHAENVTLSGTGTIDGQCHAFAERIEGDIFVNTARWRPAMTCFEDIRSISVRDLTFRNAANWTLHFSGCEDVVVENVRIDNDIRFPNADGIDPDHCKRVRISGCHIVAGDDCIVLKNTATYVRYGDCEDIEISDCYLKSASSAFKIGSESHNAFRRVRMRDCRIEDSNRGLAIQLRDGGDVEDIEFSNIEVGTRRYSPKWWGSGEVIYLTAVGRNAQTSVGSVRNVRFRNIRCLGENGILLYADPAGRIDGVSFEDVSLVIERITEWPSGLFDVRPCPEGYLPPEAQPLGADTPWGRPAIRASAAISLEGGENITFTRTSYSLPSRDSTPWIPLRADSTPTGLPTAVPPPAD